MPKLEYYEDDADQHRWRVRADNGEIIDSGEAHTRHADAVRAAGGVMHAWLDIAMQGDEIGVQIVKSSVANHEAEVDAWEVSVHGPAADYTFDVYTSPDEAEAVKAKLEGLLSVVLGHDSGNRT